MVIVTLTSRSAATSKRPLALVPTVSEPATLEAASVTASVALHAAMRPIGATRLLHAAIDWTKLQGPSAEPLIEAQPSVAKATLTRDSRRRWELARKARQESTRQNPMFALSQAIAGRKR